MNKLNKNTRRRPSSIKAKNQGSSVKSKPLIKIELPVPPSVNRLYVSRGKGKGKALTTEAKRYRELVKSIVSAHLVSLSNSIENVDGYGPEIYKLDISLKLPNLENPKWFFGELINHGKDAGKLKVKLRYKRIDADNRIKFLQDAFCISIGLDDCLVFETCVRKINDSEEGVTVTLFKLDRTKFLPPQGEPTWLKSYRESL